MSTHPILTRAYELQKSRNYSAALALLNEANFESAQLYNQLGRVLYLDRKPQAAIEVFEKALTLCPETLQQRARIRFNQALCYLALGHYPQGFALYLEKALIGDDPPKQRSVPLWQGQNVKGKKLLIHCTEGLGDSLQFLPLCDRFPLDSEITLICHKGLHPLLQTTRFNTISLHSPWPDADYYTPLYALAHYLNLKTQDLPLRFHFQSTFKNPNTLSFHKNKLSIALVWRSQSGTPSYQWRSVTLEKMIQKLVLPHPEFEWVSLQHEANLKEQHFLKQYDIKDLGSEIQHFQHSAIQLQKVDLLISVDTALAHMAGLINKPSYLLLPYEADWRWQLQKQQTPWYPKTQLFRQKEAGNWISVWQQLYQKFQKLKQAPDLGPEEISLI